MGERNCHLLCDDFHLLKDPTSERGAARGHAAVVCQFSRVKIGDRCGKLCHHDVCWHCTSVLLQQQLWKHPACAQPSSFSQYVLTVLVMCSLSQQVCALVKALDLKWAGQSWYFWPVTLYKSHSAGSDWGSLSQFRCLWAVNSHTYEDSPILIYELVQFS